MNGNEASSFKTFSPQRTAPLMNTPASAPAGVTTSAATASTIARRKFLTRLTATTPDPAATIGRVVLGAIMFPHGAQHALGWFGGYGFSGTLGWMTKTLGFPAPLAALAIVVELLAPIALVLGIGGRLAAVGIVGLMLGAIGTHLPNGFFMNWFGALPAGSEGFEYHLLVLALCAIVAIKGSGAASVDGVLARRAVGTDSRKES